MPSITNITKRAAPLLAAGAAVTAVLAGCGGSTETVCQGTPETNVLVVSTQSGFSAVRPMVPQVAQELVDETAASCGRLIVGVAGNRPESGLVLQSMTFRPRNTRAYNRKPDVTQMIATGTAFVQKQLLEPVKRAQPTSGGAYLGTLTAIGNDLHAESINKANVTIVGNAIEDEPLPTGSGTVDFADSDQADTSTIPSAGATAFEPVLGNLAGSCVKFVGAGAGTDLPDSAILSDESMLEETLASAHVGYAATRSPDVPPKCVTPKPVSIDPTPHLVVATLASDVTFKLGSATLQPGATSALKQLLPKLKAATNISVAGYTDSTGTEAINKPLSQARAASVARWIAAHTGFPVSRMKVMGFGATEPVASNNTTLGRAENRRTVITIRDVG